MMRCTRLQKSSPSVAIIFFFTLHHTLSITLASISQAGSQHLQSINILVTEKENSYKRQKNLKNQETSMFASHILNSFISKLHVYNAQKHLASVFIPFFFIIILFRVQFYVINKICYCTYQFCMSGVMIRDICILIRL